MVVDVFKTGASGVAFNLALLEAAFDLFACERSDAFGEVGQEIALLCAVFICFGACVRKALACGCFIGDELAV